MYTYGNGLQLLDLLDLVPSRGRAQTLEGRLGLRHRDEPLLRGLLSRVDVVTSEDDLIITVILIEERALVVDRARGHLHLERVLLRVLLHLLQMLVVAVLGEPGDHVAVRPVDLQSVRVLIVDVVLDKEVSINLLGLGR